MERVVEKSLLSPNDGRKTAWWVKKISALEEELARYKGVSNNGDIVNKVDWANGFIACMHNYQIMNKAARKNIHKQLEINGPKYVRLLKGSKFRGFTL